tara:strand:- start:293 stop:565 length:273 start_codon:yes stop_codon:yes gene_type:complete
MSIEKTTAQTSIRLETETLRQLKQIKKITGKSMSALLKPMVQVAYMKALDFERSSLEAQERELDAKLRYLEVKLKAWEAVREEIPMPKTK